MLGFQIFCLLIATIDSSVVIAKFKTLSCESFDKEYGDFTHCQIKAINRNKNVVNINYLQKVITNHLVIQLEFFKRANGWHPFLYNFKFDLCRFLKKNYNIILRMGYNYMRSFTNLNHSCPLEANERIQLVNYSIDIDQLRVRFPIENGEYAMHLSWFHHKKLVVTTNVSIEYFDHSDGLVPFG